MSPLRTPLKFLFVPPPEYRISPRRFEREYYLTVLESFFDFGNPVKSKQFCRSPKTRINTEWLT
jgi:hypothetical protein